MTSLKLPAVWRRIQPGLTSILETRKAQRLERERLERRIDRQRDIRVHVKNSADKAIELKEHQPFDSVDWYATFPCGGILFNLPSTLPLVETDTQGVTKEAWEAREPQFLSEVRSYQLKVRRVLASVARKESPPQTLQTVEVLPDLALNNGDADATQLLNHPTTLFTLGDYIDHYGFRSLKLAAYPSILLMDRTLLNEENYSSAHLSRISMGREVLPVAESLFQLILAMDSTMSTMKALLEMKSGFQCGCCTVEFAEPMSWPQLVGIHRIYGRFVTLTGTPR